LAGQPTRASIAHLQELRLGLASPQNLRLKRASSRCRDTVGHETVLKQCDKFHITVKNFLTLEFQAVNVSIFAPRRRFLNLAPLRRSGSLFHVTAGVRASLEEKECLQSMKK
jgi:hypothetical protein